MPPNGFTKQQERCTKLLSIAQNHTVPNMSIKYTMYVYSKTEPNWKIGKPIVIYANVTTLKKSKLETKTQCSYKIKFEKLWMHIPCIPLRYPLSTGVGFHAWPPSASSLNTLSSILPRTHKTSHGQLFKEITFEKQVFEIHSLWQCVPIFEFHNFEFANSVGNWNICDQSESCIYGPVWN